MKFKQKLALSFAAVLLLTFVVGAIGLYQLTSVSSLKGTDGEEKVAAELQRRFLLTFTKKWQRRFPE